MASTLETAKELYADDTSYSSGKSVWLGNLFRSSVLTLAGLGTLLCGSDEDAGQKFYKFRDGRTGNATRVEINYPDRVTGSGTCTIKIESEGRLYTTAVAVAIPDETGDITDVKTLKKHPGTALAPERWDSITSRYFGGGLGLVSGGNASLIGNAVLQIAKRADDFSSNRYEPKIRNEIPDDFFTSGVETTGVLHTTAILKDTLELYTGAKYVVDFAFRRNSEIRVFVWGLGINERFPVVYESRPVEAGKREGVKDVVSATPPIRSGLKRAIFIDGERNDWIGIRPIASWEMGTRALEGFGADFPSLHPKALYLVHDGSNLYGLLEAHPGQRPEYGIYTVIFFDRNGKMGGIRLDDTDAGLQPKDRGRSKVHLQGTLGELVNYGHKGIFNRNLNCFEFCINDYKSSLSRVLAQTHIKGQKRGTKSSQPDWFSDIPQNGFYMVECKEIGPNELGQTPTFEFDFVYRGIGIQAKNLASVKEGWVYPNRVDRGRYDFSDPEQLLLAVLESTNEKDADMFRSLLSQRGMDAFRRDVIFGLAQTQDLVGVSVNHLMSLPVPRIEKYRVETIESVDADMSTITYTHVTNGKPKKDKMDIEKEGGKWKYDGRNFLMLLLEDKVRRR